MTDIGGIVADGELYSASLLLGVLAVVGFIVLLLAIGFFIWHKYVVPNILFILRAVCNDRVRPYALFYVEGFEYF